MRFTLEMDCDNAAFQPEGAIYVPDPDEIKSVLADVVAALYWGKHEGRCRDSNGNTVGKWELS